MAIKRKYRKVYTRLWDHQGFRRLSLEQRHVFLYLLTGPQTNRIGFYRLRIANAAHDCGFRLADFAAALTVICEQFGWRYDSVNDVVLITTWWEYNAPESSSTMLGILRDLAELPTKTPLWIDFRADTRYMVESVRTAFLEAVEKYGDVFHVVAQIKTEIQKGMPRVSGGSPRGPMDPLHTPTQTPAGGPAVQEQDSTYVPQKNTSYSSSGAPRAVTRKQEDVAEKPQKQNTRTSQHVTRPPPAEPPLDKQAQWFIASFVDLFAEHRHGRYIVTGKDAGLVVRLLETHDAVRLLKLARLMMLIEDDDFIVGSGRDIAMLHTKVNYLENRLAETEVRRASARSVGSGG